MALSLKPGQREHHFLCILAVIIGAVLLALGALLLAQKIPKPACTTTAFDQVGLDIHEASNVDLTLVALGVPLVIGAVFLIWWGLRGNLVVLQSRRDPTKRPKPFAKQALIATSVASFCLWVHLFVSFFAAPVLQELCRNFQCGSAWATNGGLLVDGMECYGAHADLRATCAAESDVCCACKMSWNGGGTPQLVCQQTVLWACSNETLEVIISYVVIFFAVVLSSTSFFFFMVLRGRCGCVDLGSEICEAEDEDDASKTGDLPTLGPTSEDEPSPSVSPSSRSREPRAIADGQLSPSSSSRRDASQASTSLKEQPPVVVITASC